MSFLKFLKRMFILTMRPEALLKEITEENLRKIKINLRTFKDWQGYQKHLEKQLTVLLVMKAEFESKKMNVPHEIIEKIHLLKRELGEIKKKFPRWEKKV